MELQEKKIFYINSNKRISGTHSDFSYRLDLRGTRPNQVVCLQANIPKSYYMVQEGANTFSLTEGATIAQVIIPIGNYNRINFKTTLQTALNNASASLWVYTVSIPSILGADTGKYTITVSGNDTQPSFTFILGNLHELTGFPIGTTTFSNDVLVSPNVIKMQKEDCIYIKSDIVTGEAEGILQEVYSQNSSDFDNVVFINHNVEMYSKQMNGSNDNTFRFFLTNENGELLDLNGQNITLTLCVYKKDQTNEMLQTYIKHVVR